MSGTALPEWPSLDALMTWLSGVSRFVRFWGPVVSLPGLAAPAALLGSLLSLVIVSGVAVAALATFIAAAWILYVLLTEVFGVSVDLAVG